MKKILHLIEFDNRERENIEMASDELRPIIFDDIKNYSIKQFCNDLTAGIIVAIIALPLSIALALASGVRPEEGLYTAIVAGLLNSFFGGSSVQITGPTAALSTIVSGVVVKSGMEGLIVATIIAGILLIVMGALRVGSLIRYIPYTITAGFTAGVAVIIFIGQVKDFLGLTFPEGLKPVETIDKVEALFLNIGTINLWAMLVGIISLLVLVFWPKLSSKIPESLISVIVGIGIVKIWQLPVATIGDLYSISNKLPTLHFPHITIDIFRTELTNGFTIAILVAIVSLLSCVVADGMANTKHRSNQELVAQGISNIGSALFGGIPSTGAIARTAANIKNGGRTPISGMIHSIVLILVLVLLMPYASLIPMPTIAAIIFIVSYNMSGWKNCLILLKKAPKSDILVLVSTFILTIVFDLIVAIKFGIMAACILFMKRMADEAKVRGWVYYGDRAEDPDGTETRVVPKYIRVYEVTGPMFFGASDLIGNITLVNFTEIIIIRMRGVPAIDVTAMLALENLITKCEQAGVRVIFSHVNEQPMKMFEHSKLKERVGKENFVMNIDLALARAKEIHESGNQPQS